MCDAHFVMGCKLCFDNPVPPYNPVHDTSVMVNTPAVGSYEPPIQNTFISHPDPAAVEYLPQPPPLTSPEALKVTTASEEYAQACEKYKDACDAVDRMSDHIKKMNDMMVELEVAKLEAKEHKNELKKKMLEALAEED